MSTEQVPAVIDNREQLPAPIVSGNTANILSLMSTAIEKGQSSDSISQLVTIYRECVAKDAEAAFNDAKRAFQAECPPLIKNRDGATMKEEDDQGRKIKGTKPAYRFVDLDAILVTISPLLDKHGFTYDFEQEYASDVITVKCHLSHKAGHTKTTKFTGPWATNAGMSGLQKAGSATTFGQRYSLKMALGLPVGKDDDGRPERPEHDRPDERPDAPRVPPRGQRETPPLVPQSQLNAIKKEWSEVYADEIGTDKAKWRQLFADWCRKVTGDDGWNPEACAEWTTSRLDAVNAKLPGGDV